MHLNVSTIEGSDPTHKIHLVDLPDGARSFAPDPKRGEVYNRALLDWVNGIIEAETIVGSELCLARLVTAEAFEFSASTHRGHEWIDAFQSALDHREPLDSDEPPIDNLRTY